MNNRGWGFSAFLVLCAILGGALIFAVYIGVNKLNIPIENREDTNKTEETVKNEEPKKEEPKEEIDYSSQYKKLEKTIANAAKLYIIDTNRNNETSEHLIITLKSLEEKDYILPVYDIKDRNIKCIGYVSVGLDKELTYTSYIKCGSNYVTDNFTERNAE